MLANIVISLVFGLLVAIGASLFFYIEIFKDEE